jgi:hypothetical protein
MQIDYRTDSTHEIFKILRPLKQFRVKLVQRAKAAQEKRIYVLLVLFWIFVAGKCICLSGLMVQLIYNLRSIFFNIKTPYNFLLSPMESVIECFLVIRKRWYRSVVPLFSQKKTEKVRHATSPR